MFHPEKSGWRTHFVVSIRRIYICQLSTNIQFFGGTDSSNFDSLTSSFESPSSFINQSNIETHMHSDKIPDEKTVSIRDDDSYDYLNGGDGEYQQAREFLRDFHRNSQQLHTIPEEGEENGANDDSAQVTQLKRARLVKNPKVSCLSALTAPQEEVHQKSVSVSSMTTSLIDDDDQVKAGGSNSWIIPDSYDVVDDLSHDKNICSHHGAAHKQVLQCYRLEKNAIRNMKLYSSHRQRKRYHFHPSFSPKSTALTG
jgi:hypothetical protein